MVIWASSEPVLLALLKGALIQAQKGFLNGNNTIQNIQIVNQHAANLVISIMRCCFHH